LTWIDVTFERLHDFADACFVVLHRTSFSFRV
jgi:hypothetical protein